MVEKNTYWIPLAIVAILVGGCSYGQCSKDIPLEGTWECTSTWTANIDGKSVPCSVKQQGVCEQNVLSLTGVLSIGDAQWSETAKATCHGSTKALYGKQISNASVPMNDAARRFEQEKLEGKTLSDIAPPDYHVRVISRTDTQFKGVNRDDRTITCTRL
ncbi:MAG: hypothetical protein CMH54_02030 [Myxococcales bacterium]|nr:hypothetical protein [Myxococcales bacterium]